MSDVMQRLADRGAKRATHVEQIAAMLWRNGEQTAPTEGGSLPTWEELTAECKTPTQAVSADRLDFHNACWHWRLEHLHKAEALLELQPADCLALAQIMIGSAIAGQNAMEDALWAKIERANGFERGSLRGLDGVKQRTAL